MNSKLWIPAFLFIFFLGAPAQAEDLTGRQIMEEQDARHSADHEFSQVDLTLTNRKGKEKRQKMVIYTTKKAEKAKSLIQYHAPANIRGVGLLTWEQAQDAEDDQWLYLSASKSLKRIAGGSKKNQFMGTDMAFEDLRPENMDIHDYTLTGVEEVDGKPCWKILSQPSTEKEKSESGYGKRMIWVAQSNYFTLKIEYYDKHGRHIKTALFQDIRPMEGKLCRSFRVTWKRIRNKTSTLMEYRDIDLATTQKDSLFTKRYMKRPIR